MDTTSKDSLSREQISSDPITVGLVNNMPDGALRTTEWQFRTLLSAAAGGRPINLRLFTLPEVPRSRAASTLLRKYEDIGALWATGSVDGLIVTGAEPRTTDIRDEPYWASLTALIDWAEGNTFSTVWSCLAAHAAVAYRSDIERRPLGIKLSGVFDCTKSADHHLVAGLPTQWCTPHSRYNELPEEMILAKGYQILSRSADAGVDLFASHGQSLSLYVQGHPEYDSGALLREYRRDVTRFLTGAREVYPEMPRSYFDEERSTAFADFQTRAIKDPRNDLVREIPTGGNENSLNQSWRAPAVSLYTNWLRYLSDQKSIPARTAKSSVPAPTADAGNLRHSG